MSHTTYISGKIGLAGLPKVNKMQIRNCLEEIYTMQEMEDIFSEDEIVINDELDSLEATEMFLIVLWKISKNLSKDHSAIIMCTSDREGDFWAAVIKNNKLFTQRYELKPDGDIKEYEKVRF